MYIEENNDFESHIKNIKKNEYVKNFDTKQRIAVINKVSESLKKLSIKKKDPEILEVCKFFSECTEKYIKWFKLKSNFNHPRGIIYHVPSSNISLMPLYSWLPSFITGNSNLIRLSTHSKSDKFREIISLIDTILGPKEEVRQIFFEDKKDNINSYKASLACKIRILWGHSETIKNIKNTQLSNCSLDIAFQTRYSASLIQCNEFLKMDANKLKKLAKSLINDSLNLSFNACSSPHIIYFIGKKNEYTKVKNLLLSILKSDKSKSNSDLGIVTTENIFKIQNDLITKKRKNTFKNLIFGRPIIDVLSSEFVGLDLNILKNTSLFVNFSSINELKSCWRSEIQTLTYMENTDESILENMRNDLQGRGPDRFVPIGNALKFDIIWDGINFFETLTRASVINV